MPDHSTVSLASLRSVMTLRLQINMQKTIKVHILRNINMKILEEKGGLDLTTQRYEPEHIIIR